MFVRYFTFTIFFLAFTGLLAQQAEVSIVPRTVTLGGSLSGGRNSTDDTNFNWGFDISPYVLFQTGNPHWQLGASVGYGFSRWVSMNLSTVSVPFGVGVNIPITTQTEQQSDSRVLSTCLMSRYTFNPENRFQIFLSPYAALNWAKFESTDRTDDMLLNSSWSRALNIGVGTGLAYQITPAFRAIANLGSLRHVSNWSKQEMDDDYERGSRGLGLNLGLNSFRFGLEVSL